MGKTIALVNQKGGVGKTTTSINLSSSLGFYNKKILLIDLDPQGNATTGLGINHGDLDYSIYDALIGEVELKDIIIKTKFKNLSIAPANLELAQLDIILIKKSYEEEGFARSSQLKKYLKDIKDDYDYVIIDCPPSLGILTTNALTAADSVIIPVQCEFFALEGIVQLLNSILLAQKELNSSLNIEGVLLTMLDSRTNLGFEVVEEIREFFKERVYDTMIPRLVKLSEAPSKGEPILEYEANSKGALAYLNLAKEVMERNDK